MITEPTTFVLGAGASCAYGNSSGSRNVGFPLGRGLANEIVRTFQKRGTPAWQHVYDNVGSVELMNEFARVYPLSACASPDEFLASNEKFDKVVKLGIAAVLIPHENDKNLVLEERDWMAYLFSKMLPRRHEDLANNKLSIVTFNFDRSFERKLYLVIKHRYGLSDPEAAQLSATIQVIHLHGQLGHPSWLNPAETLYSREYLPRVTTETVKACANDIHVIHNDIPPDRINKARAAIKNASTVCFLGFGYHPMNLERLNIVTNGADPKQQWFGTAYRLPSGERRALERNTYGFLDLSRADVDVFQFLQDRDVIHQ